MKVAAPSATDGLILAGMEFRIDKGIVRILRLYNEFIDEVADPEALVAEVRQRAIDADLLTFVQLPPAVQPRFPYQVEWENLAVVEVSTYEHWFRKQVHENTRKKIRRAEKLGVTIQIEPFSDRLAVGLVELFNETPIRQGRRNAYYGSDLASVRRDWATELERSLWLVAYYQDELIGFIKLVLGSRIARASGTMAKVAHRDKATMNALFSEAVKVCAARGIPLLRYGRFVYGRKGEDSLTAFKKRSGFQRIDIPRYYIPLTRRGRIALCLGLQHGLKEIVPWPAMRVLLKIRSKWNQKAAAN